MIFGGGGESDNVRPDASCLASHDLPVVQSVINGIIRGTLNSRSSLFR